MKKKVVAVLLCFVLLPFVNNISAQALSAGNLASRAAVLMDYETGQVLFEKNMHELMYPASTTKIMTGILAVENAFPAELVTVSESAVDIDEPQSANIALNAGEQLTVDDVMYAMMLSSANDASNVIAEHIAGSQEQFAAMMTAKASQIGAVNTKFTNAHGLHEDEHYTTAYDLALITRYAAGDDNFMRYFGAISHDIAPTNERANPRTLVNHHSMLLPTSGQYDETVLGGKSGFTNSAQNTMSTIAERDGRKLICVVMSSVNDTDKFADTRRLLDYGFNEFASTLLEDNSFEPLSVPLTLNGETVGEVYFEQPPAFATLLHNEYSSARIVPEYNLPTGFLQGELPYYEVTYSVEEAPEGTPAFLGARKISGRIRPLGFEEPGSFINIEDDAAPMSALPIEVIPLELVSPELIRQRRERDISLMICAIAVVMSAIVAAIILYVKKPYALRAQSKKTGSKVH